MSGQSQPWHPQTNTSFQKCNIEPRSIAKKCLYAKADQNFNCPSGSILPRKGKLIQTPEGFCFPDPSETPTTEGQSSALAPPTVSFPLASSVGSAKGSTLASPPSKNSEARCEAPTSGDVFCPKGKNPLFALWMPTFSPPKAPSAPKRRTSGEFEMDRFARGS
ncbi:hypothetical protein RRG08_057340 [Elysia crispata]|uniref:Uncharacterized protein n=1 Tax=Elysia crispata TaxID=231223 RepID=A0AAE0YJP9_9GAST|nr:hypothetical protein RRG08_057340 [Elysia crispata]